MHHLIISVSHRVTVVPSSLSKFVACCYPFLSYVAPLATYCGHQSFYFLDWVLCFLCLKEQLNGVLKNEDSDLKNWLWKRYNNFKN
jgi:hypothetical protein